MAVKVVTFGEIMLRLSPPGFERLLQSPSLVATFGGGEANVAVSLAHFGLDSWYVTRLPKNPIGDAAIRALRAEGVRTDAIVRGGDRVGIYFAESGASQRASVVVYDRARSAISEMEPAAVEWPTVFAGAAWFHVTGITPALGPKAVACTQAAVATARKAGARVSVDLNFRKKLWSEEAAQQVMRPLMADVDVLIANEEDIQAVLGLTVEGTDVTNRAVERGGLSASGRAHHQRTGPFDGRDYPARECLGQRQWLERSALGRTRRGSSTRASAMTCVSWIASAAATALPAASSMDY